MYFEESYHHNMELNETDKEESKDEYQSSITKLDDGDFRNQPTAWSASKYSCEENDHYGHIARACSIYN